MKEILYDDVLKKIPNKYELTIIAGKRGRDIMLGAEFLSVGATEKDTIVKKVLTEILEDKIGVGEDCEEE